MTGRLRASWTRRDPATWALIGTTVVGGALRYWYAAHAGFAAANDIDGATYFAGAVQLVHGRLAYRDFAFVQPPAVLLVGAPFAFLSRSIGTQAAFTSIRALMPVVGTVNVALVGLRVRSRGVFAVLAGGGVMAVYVPAVISTRTLLLEPWLDLLCLLALLLAFDDAGRLGTPRRTWWAGVCLGLATAFKLWALLPFAVLVGCCRWARAPRKAVWVVLGTAAGFSVVSGAFVVAAPGQFFHDVVISQLSRFGTRVPFSSRMGEVLGLTQVGHLHPVPTATIVAAFALAALLLAGAGLALHRLGRRPSSLAICAVVSSVVVFVALMVPGEFPYHYPDFLSPFATVSLGLAAAALLERFAQRPRTRLIAALGAGVAVLVVLGFVVPLLDAPEGPRLTTVVDRLVPPNACVVTDFTAISIAADRYVTTDRGCPVIVDPYGWDLTLDRGSVPSPGHRPTAALVAAWRSAFERTNWIVLSATAHGRIPFVRSIDRYLRRDFTRVAAGSISVWERTSVLRARGGGTRT